MPRAMRIRRLVRRHQMNPQTAKALDAFTHGKRWASKEAS